MYEPMGEALPAFVAFFSSWDFEVFAETSVMVAFCFLSVALVCVVFCFFMVSSFLDTKGQIRDKQADFRVHLPRAVQVDPPTRPRGFRGYLHLQNQ